MSTGLNNAIKSLFSKYGGKSHLSEALKKKRQKKGKKSVLHKRQPSNETKFHAENYHPSDEYGYDSTDGGDVGLVRYVQNKHSAQQIRKSLSKKKKVGKNKSKLHQHVSLYDGGTGGEFAHSQHRIVTSKLKSHGELNNELNRLYALEKKAKKNGGSKKELAIIDKKISLIYSKLDKLKSRGKHTNLAISDYNERHSA